MKVLIVRCSNNKLWYYKKVGNIYKVEKTNPTNYLTKEGVVIKNDCEVIK